MYIIANKLSKLCSKTTPTKKKRKRSDDTNEFLPDGPTDEASKYGSLEFNEVLDEDVSFIHNLAIH